MTRLTVIRGEARATPAFAPPPLALDDRTQRPGELADIVVVALEEAERVVLQAAAARARLPQPLFAVIAVEAARVLGELAPELGLSPTTLAAIIDESSVDAAEAAFDPRPARPLRAYARLLRSGSNWPEGSGVLTLLVADRLRARWSLAAQDEGLTLEAWIAAKLTAAPPGVELWEAHAATDGRTLCEWMTLQAVRRCRCSSKAAQASA